MVDSDSTTNDLDLCSLGLVEMIVDIRARGNKVCVETEHGDIYPFSQEKVDLTSMDIGKVRIHCRIDTLDVRGNNIELVTVHGKGDVILVIYDLLHPEYLNNVMSRVMKREDGMSLHSTQDVYPFFEYGWFPLITRAKIRESMDSIKGVTRKPRGSVWEGVTLKRKSQRTMIPKCSWMFVYNDSPVVSESADESIQFDLSMFDPAYAPGEYTPVPKDTIDTPKEVEQPIPIFDEIDGFLERSAPKRTSIGKEMRANVWKRHCGEKFKGNCYACRKDLDILGSWHCSHIVPHRHGGETAVTNLVPCCRTCNLRNSSVDLHEWMYLEKNPNLDSNIKVMYTGIYVGTNFAKALAGPDCEKYFSPRVPLDMRVRLLDYVINDGCT